MSPKLRLEVTCASCSARWPRILILPSFCGAPAQNTAHRFRTDNPACCHRRHGRSPWSIAAADTEVSYTSDRRADQRLSALQSKTPKYVEATRCGCFSSGPDRAPHSLYSVLQFSYYRTLLDTISLGFWDLEPINPKPPWRTSRSCLPNSEVSMCAELLAPATLTERTTVSWGGDGCRKRVKLEFLHTLLRAHFLSLSLAGLFVALLFSFIKRGPGLWDWAVREMQGMQEQPKTCLIQCTRRSPLGLLL